jgi:Mn2+/Fe2+ NRAMP family transporter
MTETADPTDPASATYDPYALDPAAIQEPPRSLWLALRQIGPGLILAGSIVGTGELIATTHLGAKVGFALLWLVIVSCLVKVAIQIELGRHALSSGQTTLFTFSQLPGPGIALVWWYAIMTLVTQFQLGAMIGGVGQALHLAFPALTRLLSFGNPYLAEHPEVPWAIITTLITIALLYSGSYGIVEKASTFMVVTFTLMTVGCVVLLPFAGHQVDWKAAAHGLEFTIPAGAVIAALTMFGITGVGASELIAYPYWCIEKGYARKTGARPASETISRDAWSERARGWLRVMKLDAWVCMAIYTTATLAFYFLGAAVLHGPNSEGLPRKVGPMLDRLAGMYVPVLGVKAAIVFIVIGAIAVLYSTLISATAGNARGFTDILHIHRLIRVDALDGATQRRRWIRFFCVLTPLLNLFLFLYVKDPVKMVTIGGFTQAMTLPMIGAAAVYLRYKRTDKRIVSGWWWDIFLWVSLTALCVAAAYGMWDAVGSLRK